jgi:hypothetical protein
MLDSTGVRRAFSAYLDRLIISLDGRPDVVGLVLTGSTADRSRVDEWSDHDFFVVCSSRDAAEAMRQNLDWLPDIDSLIMSVRETEHGLKGLYRDGRVLEFAVFGPDELRLAHANAFEVPLDRGGIYQAMRQVAARPKPGSDTTPLQHAQLFLALLLIGVGRARRGELLTAGQFIRTHALTHLLALHRRLGPTPSDPRLDDLDLFRRLEQVHPDLADVIERALERDPETAARGLLYVAEATAIARWNEWPADAAQVVKERLGWAEDLS